MPVNVYSGQRRIENSALRLLPEVYRVTGPILAHVAWYLWFGFILLSTIFARMDKEPIPDSIFAQGTGIISAVAILLTLRPRGRSQRLHGIMLALCCLVYFGLQRPMAFTPHGTFLRSFKSVQEGMTVAEVRTRMLPYDFYVRDHSASGFMDTSLAPQWWRNNHYSGRLHFTHNDSDSIDGFYDVTFTDGKVTEIQFYND